ncbi:MAG: hypothetical protein Q9M43_09620 [Sulfurimonas sp.]|nr:hypothetical protein [Sulfurimonas sp.]
MLCIAIFYKRIKKVSFFCVKKDINQKYSFLPWFDKIRVSFPISADLAISFACGSHNEIAQIIECDLINIDSNESNKKFGNINLVDASCISTAEVVYSFFKTHKVTINPKMATALYAGLLESSNGFLSRKLKGTTIACIQELIGYKADVHSSNRFVMQYQTLAGLRLKAIMLSNMRLLNNAEIAFFSVTDEDVKKCAALEEDTLSALEEALYLPTVKVSVLLRENTDTMRVHSLDISINKNIKKQIIDIIKKEI